MKLWVFLIVLLLAGCKNALEPSSVEVISMPLLALHDFGNPLQLQQQVKGEYAGKQHDMLCVLEVHANQLSLAGLSPQGVKLFGLQYDGSNVQQSRSAWVPEQLKPVQVLSDIQLALWPAEQIARQLPTSWQLKWSEGQRQLFKHDQLYAEVIYTEGVPLKTGGTFKLVNHYYEYSLQVQTIEVATL